MRSGLVAEIPYVVSSNESYMHDLGLILYSC